MKRAISIALFSLLAGSTAGAADLLSVYKDALSNDPTIRQADALRSASREVRPQAWALLLPQITGQGQYTRGRTENTSSTPQAIFDENQVPIGAALVERTSILHPD